MSTLAHSNYRKNLSIIFGITLIAVLGVTSIAPVFPKISEELHIPPETVAMLITIFTLPGIFLTPVLGILADRFGRKIILIPSLFLFAVTGTACAFTNDFTLLLIYRFFQGCGAAALGSLNVTLIGDLFSGKDRIKIMGYNGTVLSLATGSYPLLGGSIALLGWNYPFLLSLLAVPVGLGVIFLLKNPEPERTQTLSSYLKGWIRVMANPRLMILFVSGVSTFMLLYGVLITYFPFFMKKNFDAGPFLIGLVISSASISTAIAALNLGRLSRIFKQKNLVAAAFFMYAAAIIITPFIEHIQLMFIPTLIYGFANGINMPNVNSLIADIAPMEFRGAVMSLNGMILRIGQTIGPLITGLIFIIFNMNGIFIISSVFAASVGVIILYKLGEYND